MNKPILHLNVKRKWFDMIKSGEKKEEYREITSYWGNKFMSNIRIKNKHYHPQDVIICFSNGYKKEREQIYVECLDIWVGYGKPEWGAEPDKQYFILKLGRIHPSSK